MHIVDGVLSAPVLLAGAGVAVAGTAVGLRTLDHRNLPVTGVLSATFFVASLIHVPLGFSSVHLVLNGLLGLLLGWLAFPAVLIAAALQAVFFGYGGLFVLGVNVANVALPAVLLGALLRPWIWREGRGGAGCAFALGAGSVLATSVLVALSLALSGEAFWVAAQLTVVSHLPVALIEGFLCVAALSLVRRVRPGFLAEAWQS